jgi:hypothetical protein
LTELRARLDRSGRRILCGYRECGAQLGLILEDSEGRRSAWLGDEWTPEIGKPRGGTWRVTNRSRQQLSRRRQPRQRRPPGGDREADDIGPGDIVGWELVVSPVAVECWMCGWLQTLEVAVLRLRPNHVTDRRSPGSRRGLQSSEASLYRAPQSVPRRRR